ncbi:MAG TPA: hypothetical protein VFD13_00845 [Candidatus Kapabacteria bacterium]|nr:hypothetical protein [Candidatus Kapabacteria bacterium]
MSFAFSSNGHSVIEASAYRHLLARANIARLSAIAGHTFSGKDALDALIAYRILDRPHDWPKGESEDPLMVLPILRSGNLDYILSRQFEGNSQCFHFMARSSDVYWDTTTDPTYGYPHDLYDSAYPRCVAFLTSTFQVVLNNALAARAGDHDVYGLMHSIADSYCAAHVMRDSNGRIIYLKVWEPTSYIPYLLHPQAERFYDGPWGHKMTDERDDQYWNDTTDDPTCSSSTNPYQVDDDCLAPRAKEAVRATEELLIVLAENVLREREFHGIDSVYEQASWKEYLGKFFVGWKGVAPARPLRADEREWRPLVHAGLEYHSTTDLRPARDFTADFNFDVPIPSIAPISPGLLISYGEREYGDRTASPLLRIGYGLAFEFADDFELRMAPFEREFVLAPGHKGETRNLVSIFQIEGIVDRHFWFRAEAPRFSTQGWIPNDYGISAGWSDGWDLGKWFSELIGTRTPLPIAGDKWKTPSAEEIKSAKLGSGMSLSVTVINFEFNPYANHLYGASTQIMWDRNSGGERNRGFANGFELDYSLRDFSSSEDDPSTGEVGYIFRYYLTPHLALTSEPLDYVRTFNGAEPHPTGNFAWDLESTVGVMALLIHSDLTIGFMRISWRDAFAHVSPFYQNFPAGLRIGANFFIP